MKKLIFLALLFTGCSGANTAALMAWGSSHHVQCWSGGVKIYDGHSTGKIENEEHSDGYYFKEKGSNKLIGVSGNCLIEVD